MRRLCAHAVPASRVRVGHVALGGLLAMVLGACSSPGGTTASPRLGSSSSVGVSTTNPDQPARAPAIVDGRVVSWRELRARTGEIAGAAALEEIVLDRALERELERAGLALDAGAIERERSLLLEEIAPGGDGAQVLALVRRQRGLGDVGFERLLRRNAMLRALSAPSVRVEDREIDLALRIRYGPRRLARIIVTPGEREASALRREILAAAGDRLDAFTARAATRSIDASGARGGRLGSVSPLDPAIPDSVRQSVASLRVGQVSSVLSIDGGYAIVIVEGDVGPESTGDRERATTERSLRLRKQRLEMDRLADRLLARASVSVLDPSLAWSWAGRGGGE